VTLQTAVAKLIKPYGGCKCMLLVSTVNPLHADHPLQQIPQAYVDPRLDRGGCITSFANSEMFRHFTADFAPRFPPTTLRVPLQLFGDGVECVAVCVAGISHRTCALVSTCSVTTASWCTACASAVLPTASLCRGHSCRLARRRSRTSFWIISFEPSSFRLETQAYILRT
jgi:hypothetical protein